MHLLPLARQQPVCVSPARLAVQMFKMVWVVNYRTELPAASTSLATVFFSHSHQRLLWPDQRPPSPGLKGKHLQSCWTLLSCNINVTLSALVVRYFWAGGGRTHTIKKGEKSLECAKTPNPYNVLACWIFYWQLPDLQTCFHIKADPWISEDFMLHHRILNWVESPRRASVPYLQVSTAEL